MTLLSLKLNSLNIQFGCQIKYKMYKNDLHNDHIFCLVITQMWIAKKDNFKSPKNSNSHKIDHLASPSING